MDRTPIWRLIGGDTGDKLARPEPVRDRYGKLRRNPAGEWDGFYCLDDGCQAYIRRYVMGADGLTPDDCAALTGFGYDTDAWWAALASAVRTVQASADDWHGEYAADDAETLIGPDELAELLQVSRGAIRQWRYRGNLPAADLTLSGLPIWTLGTVRLWAAETNRTITA